MKPIRKTQKQLAIENKNLQMRLDEAAAWSKEKAREYIRTSAGTHFDPQVVDVFMQTPN